MPTEAKSESQSSLGSSNSERKKKVSFNSISSKEKSAAKPRRLSLKLLRGDSKKGDSKKSAPKTSIFDEKSEESLVERDPVIELLEARSTQRVRFTLDTSQENPASTPTADKTCDRDTPASNKSSRFNVKNFMGRNIFNKDKSDLSEELNDPDMAEANKHSSILWKSAVEGDNSDFVHTVQSQGSELIAFAENPKTRAEVVKLLNKGRRAQHKYYKYEYAVKCHVKALELLNIANYPDDHPTMVKTVDSLNSAHHALCSYTNSANIVKIGIRCEDSGDLVRALKMYTIAYRIRRDSLSPNHPSLVVLLNILGSIQVKRGELHEAMQVFELACKDAPPDDEEGEEDPNVERAGPKENLLARSVTYREMGGIHEKLGNEDEAVIMYHKSLECATRWRESHARSRYETPKTCANEELTDDDSEPLLSLANVQLSRSSAEETGEDEAGGMELCIDAENIGKSGDKSITDFYNSFFPPYDDKLKKKKGNPSEDQMDLDIALTLHQIAQMYRRQGQHGRALDAYSAALRGMKYALGPHHPNVAAILGNQGNLQNEMGDFDSAYDTYQEVLGIESYRLGFSHPEVAVSIHNIATIEAARGKYDHALSLYSKVLALQRKLYGEEHQAVAITASCMGDVHIRLGDIDAAMSFYEQSYKIKMVVFGRHNLEVARMLHKMGKVAFQQRNYNLADSYISRAFLLYRMNKLGEDHEWVVDAYKDGADVDAAVVMAVGMGDGESFAC
jgi:tetratricopeptide (TPR) repeat protein